MTGPKCGAVGDSPNFARELFVRTLFVQCQSAKTTVRAQHHFVRRYYSDPQQQAICAEVHDPMSLDEGRIQEDS